MTFEEAKELLNNELLNTYSEKKAVAIDVVLKELENQDTEINKLKKQLQNISDEFLKYDWKNSTNEQIYNQLKSLYESIFMKEDK